VLGGLGVGRSQRILVIAFAGWELSFSRNRRGLIALLAATAAIGFAVDSGYVIAGLMQFATPVPWSNYAPVWIVGMWISFALTLNQSLAWLKNRPVAAVALGAIGGPFAYWVAGSAWNAVDFTHSTPAAMVAVGLVWGIATPLLLSMANRAAPALEQSP
jgi:hypothetical protein